MAIVRTSAKLIASTSSAFYRFLSDELCRRRLAGIADFGFTSLNPVVQFLSQNGIRKARVDGTIVGERLLTVARCFGKSAPPEVTTQIFSFWYLARAIRM